MCGRFVASRPVEEIAELLEVDDIEVPSELVEPRWNVAPQASVLGVTARVPRQPAHAPDEGDGTADADTGPVEARTRLTVYRWGLVPSWAKDPSVGNKMFNARAESLLDKPAFRTALAKRRCLVPADAFYEWEKGSGSRASPGRRQPWIFRPPDDDILTFAGLWEAWRPRQADPETGEVGEWLLSCTIITSDANEVVAPVHDRMPVIVPAGDRAAWIAPGSLDQADLASFLRPAPQGALVAYRVSAEVNDARSEGPELAEPLDGDGDGDGGAGGESASGAPEQGSLFDSL